VGQHHRTRRLTRVAGRPAITRLRVIASSVMVIVLAVVAHHPAAPGPPDGRQSRALTLDPPIPGFSTTPAPSPAATGKPAPEVPASPSVAAAAINLGVPEIGPAARSLARNAVAGGSADSGISGWSAHSASGTVKVAQAGQLTGPFGSSTGLSLSRTGGNGDWAFTLLPLNDPESFFTPGATYRMQAWVRDLAGSRQHLGLLLANGNYEHRPTTVTQYTDFTDSGWHLLTRTFVCTKQAAADTALYLALPGTGSFAFQLTEASVTAVQAAGPSQVSTGPIEQIAFPGGSGTRPSTSVWNYETGGHGWGNDELQTYTNSPRNSQIDGSGRLRITARREQLRGADGITRGYTSARLTTKGKVSVQPGSYVEASITAPTGAGVWPAFWMVGTDIDSVGWPASGELDVFEGRGPDPKIAHSAVHMSGLSDPAVDHGYGWDTAGASTRLDHRLDSRSHLYGVYFDGQTARFFVDRQPTLSLWASDALASGRVWPFGKPQYMIVNLAVADDPGAAKTSFPKAMTVSSISVWQGGIPF
jgi:hypothetical protein